MTYDEAVDWLFNAVPNFQRDGGNADYKIGLEGPMELWGYLGNPAENIPTIHIAGTNGKGSSAHLIAAGLKEMGQKVGVFSSPHLFSFRERAKIGTVMIPESFVSGWVKKHKPQFENAGYSFFELTLMLSLCWFQQQNVHWIILETGMGGRLDATNICSPEVCLITNIGLDHQKYLGNTFQAIAKEKAGIIKIGVPVVISEKDDLTYPVFASTAAAQGAPLFCSTEFTIDSDLKGDYQKKNINGAATLLNILYPEFKAVWTLGMGKVTQHTGFFGRWSQISDTPKVIVDTAHNPNALKGLLAQVQGERSKEVYWIIGASADKDVHSMMEVLPEGDHYIWVSTSNPRTLEARQLQEIASKTGKRGKVFEDVNSALEHTKAQLNIDDMIVVTGSNFIVADLKL